MDLVTYTEEVLNGKLHFLWSDPQVLAQKVFLKIAA